MSYLLFPGRHLVNTNYQSRYLKRVLTEAPDALPGFVQGRAGSPQPPKEILFAITSANQQNSRFNPIPFHIRAIGVDRFARALQGELKFRYRIVGVPHYGHTRNFAAFIIKEIAHQTEQAVQLAPENCVVLCSTPEVIAMYRDLGFSIVPAELAELEPRPATPIALITEIGAQGNAWPTGPLVRIHLAESHVTLFNDFPEIPQRIARLYQDPLTTQDGGLTATRNYSTYARGMNEIIRLKYLDIREAIRPGRIVDEGCADGALLTEVSRDFPDSDLFGIDLSSEFASRFHERQRAGEFGDAYVHFFHRNLLDRIFEPGSIDTTICNSTLHELWSYGDGAESVRRYLSEKFQQLRSGGRLIVRDVVGPEDGDREVLLSCSDTDGANIDPEKLKTLSDRRAGSLRELSTGTRFRLFAHDFGAACRPFRFDEVSVDGRSVFRLSLRDAAEFLSKKDYTDNWSSEMNEEFCFWSFTEWKRALADAGFEVRENPNEPSQGSRAYTSQWIVENRYAGHAALMDLSGNPLPWPPTNIVLVGEKRLVA